MPAFASNLRPSSCNRPLARAIVNRVERSLPINSDASDFDCGVTISIEISIIFFRFEFLPICRTDANVSLRGKWKLNRYLNSELRRPIRQTGPYLFHAA